MNQKNAFTICCILLIFLFVYTAASKLLDFNQFVQDINNQPFPNWMTPFFVITLPIIELTAASLLFFDVTRKQGLLISSVLMTLFTVYILLILLNVFEQAPCSCGGALKNLTWTQHFLFNLFFTAVSIYAYLLEKNINAQNLHKRIHA